MPPRRPQTAPAKRIFQPLPQNTFWIETTPTTGASGTICAPSRPSLREVEDKGSTLLPHFGSLAAGYLLSAFQVQHQLPRRTPKCCPSALLNQKFLHAIHQGAQYDFLREQTLLNEAHAGLVDVDSRRTVAGFMREEKLLTRRDMRDLWDIQKQEELVGQKMEEYDNADTIPEDQLSEEGKKALQKAKEKMAGEVQGAEALLRHKTHATQGRS